MDFGGVLGGLDTGVLPATASVFSAVSDVETKLKWCGSGGFLKQERPPPPAVAGEDDWRETKFAKTSTAAILRSNANGVSESGQQMLSFSSANSQTLPLPSYHAAFSRNSGYGGLNSGNMHGLVSGVRGPFTPSQWMELEHQALIYKYITANVPIPPYLLNPIRKAFDSAALSAYSGLRPNSFGWGAFHLGFSNTTDPEPGRCRRTDGKKWRCSRDAVADQKYCERHMNRGRHRSRKPVEGQAGTTAAATTKLMPPATSSASAAVVVPGGSVSDTIGFSNHNNLQPFSTNPSPPSHLYRSFLDKGNQGEKESQQHSIIKDQHHPYEASSRSGFGLVCSNPLLNPLSKGGSSSYSTTHEDVSDRESKTRHSLHQFMDDWPKNQPDIDLQSDQTRLSISIPMSTSDFMSSTSSPVSEKLAASPLKLSWEHETTTQMGLGVGAVINQRQGNWIPIAWESSSVGGPLGEVFHSTNSKSSGDCKNASAPLNLMEGWDGSPRMASSPTGVLQKAAFCSHSNSSAGSSPRAENNSVMNPSLQAL
ncbi:PREDICTED: growth-regulating factor 1-like [Ipomoea nil]|uniref:growth-regulating factor 1-like n=1 Tax=Ipomoea nil TaxID=35883 RepID=UPI0009016936|nr:PREDICTED: growth-regulating factor 1-like [Ipomoea nil]